MSIFEEKKKQFKKVGNGVNLYQHNYFTFGERIGRHVSANNNILIGRYISANKDICSYWQIHSAFFYIGFLAKRKLFTC